MKVDVITTIVECMASNVICEAIQRIQTEHRLNWLQFGGSRRK